METSTRQRVNVTSRGRLFFESIKSLEFSSTERTALSTIMAELLLYHYIETNSVRNKIYIIKYIVIVVMRMRYNLSGNSIYQRDLKV